MLEKEKGVKKLKRGRPSKKQLEQINHEPKTLRGGKGSREEGNHVPSLNIEEVDKTDDLVANEEVFEVNQDIIESLEKKKANIPEFRGRQLECPAHPAKFLQN